MRRQLWVEINSLTTDPDSLRTRSPYLHHYSPSNLLFVIAVTGLALLTDGFDATSGGAIGAAPVGGSDSTATM